MGLFESIKNTFSKSEPAADLTASPSQLLREAGVDPGGLKFTFGNAEITVKGSIDSESDRQKILAVLSGIAGIDDVHDQLSVSAPVAAAEAPASTAKPPKSAEPAEPVGGEDRTYTVVSGDTLWKIAERMYGNGSQYMKIFEANTDILENPDRIFPGQKLLIPE
jgi:nucleoid-associated protein YgaU